MRSGKFKIYPFYAYPHLIPPLLVQRYIHTYIHNVFAHPIHHFLATKMTGPFLQPSLSTHTHLLEFTSIGDCLLAPRALIISGISGFYPCLPPWVRDVICRPPSGTLKTSAKKKGRYVGESVNVIIIILMQVGYRRV